LINALKQQHEFFNKNGCKMSDHGIDQIVPIKKDKKSIEDIFFDAINGKSISKEDHHAWQYFFLKLFASWNKEMDWTMQLHIGAIRNNNKKMLHTNGRDIGCDSIGDFNHATNLNKFLSDLSEEDILPKVILYNSNPKDNYVFASIVGNFFEDGVVGKIKYGAAWWFMDSENGIKHQLNALSEVGLFSKFIGMVTDSRSFLSFSRHDYFRRIVCNLIGEEVESGKIHHDMNFYEKILTDIFYKNAQDILRDNE
jgi:glucuronate isomerase